MNWHGRGKPPARVKEVLGLKARRVVVESSKLGSITRR